MAILPPLNTSFSLSFHRNRNRTSSSSSNNQINKNSLTKCILCAALFSYWYYIIRSVLRLLNKYKGKESTVEWVILGIKISMNQKKKKMLITHYRRAVTYLYLCVYRIEGIYYSNRSPFIKRNRGGGRIQKNV